MKAKYLVHDRDRHGKTRYYVRVPGYKKVCIKHPPDSKEFWEAYAAALKPPIPVKERFKKPEIPIDDTFNSLCLRYYVSTPFLMYKPATKSWKRYQLDKFCKTYGHLPFNMIESQHIEKVIGKMLDTPFQADKLLKCLRPLFKWAKKQKLITYDPAAEVDYLKVKPEGVTPWSRKDIQQYQDQHPVGTRAWLALALLLYTGQRRSDVVLMGPENVVDNYISLRQVKTEKRVTVFISPELQEAIDACPSVGDTFLTTHSGGSFTSASFGNWFKLQCKKAGLDHLSAHGLRKASSAFAVENEATAAQLQAVYGYTLQTAEIYIRSANQKKLARDISTKIVQPLDTKVSNLSQPIEIVDKNPRNGGPGRGKKSE